MQRPNKLFAKVQNRSGASLLFVLAIMLLLMAVGASALVAASAAAGAELSKQTGDRLDLYAESLHKSIMYSLQTSGDTDPDIGDIGKDINGTLKSLGGQLLKEIYGEALSSEDKLDPDVTAYSYSTALTPLILTPTLTGGEAGALAGITQEITLSIEPYVYVVKEYTPEHDVWNEEAGESGKETETPVPRAASISATVTVMIQASHQDKSLTSAVTYHCTGALLTQNNTTSPVIIEEAGTWEFVSYEKIDR